MNIEHGDIWDKHRAGAWVGIPTNHIINARGELVMGRGVAFQAKSRFPGLARRLGNLVAARGNICLFLTSSRLFTFPVKQHWRDQAMLSIIRNSAEQLAEWLDGPMNPSLVYLPKPGCGNGRLRWEDVEPILDETLGHTDVIVVDLP